MERSQGLFQRAKKIFPGGVHSPVRAFGSVGGAPVFFESGTGAWLRSVDGKDYIDFCLSFGPLILGHRDPAVEQAVRAMVGKAWSLGACEPYSLALGEWMVERLPWVEKLRFVSSGTEAVMSALRVARAFTGRSRVLKFSGCYHGHFDSLLVKAGSGLAGLAASSSAGVSENVASDTLVAPLDDEGAVATIFAEHGRSIAAVILEPLPANYGLLPQRQEFIESVMALARANGSLVIFDEVISGFRIGMRGMAERFAQKPDLVTYGKVIGGGFPVGAYGGRADLMQLVAPEGNVYQAGTLSANPVGMAAGLATLERLENANGHAVLAARTEAFCQSLTACFAARNAPLTVTSEGSVFWMHGGDRPWRHEGQITAAYRDWFPRFFQALLKRGVYFPPSAYEVCFLSLAHEEKVLAEALSRIDDSLEEASG